MNCRCGILFCYRCGVKEDHGTTCTRKLPEKPKPIPVINQPVINQPRVVPIRNNGGRGNANVRNNNNRMQNQIQGVRDRIVSGREPQVEHPNRNNRVVLVNNVSLHIISIE